MSEHRHRTQTADIAAAVNRPPEARTMTVIAVDFRRGEGCCEEDPVRLVTAYYDLRGELLAEYDTWQPSQSRSGGTETTSAPGYPGSQARSLPVSGGSE